MPLPNDDFDYSDTIHHLLVRTLISVEDSFPKFMRLQWS